MRGHFFWRCFGSSAQITLLHFLCQLLMSITCDFLSSELSLSVKILLPFLQFSVVLWTYLLVCKQKPQIQRRPR
jgi:hypothetical protein